MKTKSKKHLQTIDEYILMFPQDIQELLETLRQTIQEAAPGAEETISYQIPTFRLNGNLVHFAAFRNHIGFYPTPSGIETFREELSIYGSAKGSVKFPLTRPLPVDLVRKIVRFRVQENLQRHMKKK